MRDVNFAANHAEIYSPSQVGLSFLFIKLNSCTGW